MRTIISDGAVTIDPSVKRINDLAGKKFGKLTAIKIVDRKVGYGFYWLCKCDCGNTSVVLSSVLKNGRTKSCGCVNRAKSSDRFRKMNIKHGLHNHPLYKKWKGIRKRCNCPTEKQYCNYGGRGIRVDRRWDDFETFYQWAINNGWEEGLTIDRIDNDGDYSPENCRFVTNKEQVRNRRKTVYLTYNGQRKPLSQWCEELGLNMKTCYGRLHYYGWTNPQEILFGKGA